MSTSTDPSGIRAAGKHGAAEDQHALDHPVWAALTGPHAHLALTSGRAVRYPADVAPFAAVDDPRDPAAWQSLAGFGEGGMAVPVVGDGAPPEGWDVFSVLAGVQLVETSVDDEPDPAAVLLGPGDVPEMLDLVARTQPGPFRPRTIELGDYYGVRDAGRLIAMAGERLKVPGWCEVSAVCTDPDHRGQGLATRLIRTVAAGAHKRGERVFLHAAAENAGAIRLYESIGFRLRSPAGFHIAMGPLPGSAAAPDAGRSSGDGAVESRA
jgi:ribosomal protein S18 acetylase RimI-like enzyme